MKSLQVVVKKDVTLLLILTIHIKKFKNVMDEFTYTCLQTSLNQ